MKWKLHRIGLHVGALVMIAGVIAFGFGYEYFLLPLLVAGLIIFMIGVFLGKEF